MHVYKELFDYMFDALQKMLQRFHKKLLVIDLPLGIFTNVYFLFISISSIFLIHCCVLFFVYVSLLVLLVYGQNRSEYKVVNCISHAKINKK